MIYRYSPRPILDYRIPGLDQDEVTVMLGHERREALWNLFWMSHPGIDSVPEAGHNWWKGYKPVIGALSAIISDVTEDEVLYRKLMLHPFAFKQWFEREDHTIYDCYDVMNGVQWVSNVLARSELAGTRMTIEDPPVRIDGNVVHVKFKQSA